MSILAQKHRHPSAPTLLLAALLAAPAGAAGQVSLDGRIVLPVDDGPAVDGEGLGDATVKGNVRSAGGQLGQRLQRALRAGLAPLQVGAVGGAVGAAPTQPAALTPANAQVNDPALDYVMSFDPAVVATRPFEFSTNSETSMVTSGRHVVVGYNSSAGAEVQFFPGFGLAFTQLFFSGWSVSHDGGRTWASGFVPPVSPDSPFTFGDPALAMDRRGNVYYASLGTDALGASAVIINRSTDRGDSFGPATVVALDDGSDKEWLAIGPDPRVRSRDNLYVTWTSFAADGSGSSLWLARSLDGGATWSSARLYAPADDGATSSSFIQFSNPVVDASSGRLYIPFLHFSDIDADNLKVLVSDDGGGTFRFLRFNVAGWPDPEGFPVVAPGILNDCGSGGLRLALHQGAAGPGRFGLPQYAQATRLVTQPAAAAGGGRLVLAYNVSTSPFFGDPTAGSEIRMLYSPDGGRSWSGPLTVAASTTADPQHVHPALALDGDGEHVHVGYYAQQADERLRTDLARVHLDGRTLVLEETAGLSSTAFDLTPSNIPRPTAARPFETTNYDRTIAHCYDIGEYMSVRFDAASGATRAAWGDNRNRWTGPPGSSAPFEHAQPDVFFGTARD